LNSSNIWGKRLGLSGSLGRGERDGAEEGELLLQGADPLDKHSLACLLVTLTAKSAEILKQLLSDWGVGGGESACSEGARVVRCSFKVSGCDADAG